MQEKAGRLVTAPAEGLVTISEGFRWDDCDAYLFDIDGTLLHAHGGSHVVPFDLGEKIRQGLEALRIAPSSRIHFATAMQPILAQRSTECETNKNPAVERVGKGKRFL